MLTYVTSKSGKKKSDIVDCCIIVNFEVANVLDQFQVRENCEVFGDIRTIIMCKNDCCQAFIAFRDRSSVERIFEFTNGFMTVDDVLWTICRPESQKEFQHCNMQFPINPTIKNHKCTNQGSKNITEIYHNFWNNLSSESQFSLASSASSIIAQASSVSSSTSSSTLVASNSSFSLSNSGLKTPDTCFQQLAPPFHILPDTPFFRNAHIILPQKPNYENDTVSQRIINQYLDSMQYHDHLQFQQLLRECEQELEDEITIQEYDDYQYQNNQWFGS